jgi:hypothetical protein
MNDEDNFIYEKDELVIGNKENEMNVELLKHDN